MPVDTQSSSLARILVVDDEAPIRAAIARALNLLNYAADEANGGVEALQRLQAAHYDLMVLDMQMPTMHGREVMERARQLCPDLLIIVLTGHATLDSAISAVKTGVVDYLIKPVSVHEIAQTITRSLQNRADQIRRQQLIDLLGQTVDALRDTGSLPITAGAPASPPAEVATSDRFVQAGSLMLDRSKRLLVIKTSPLRTVELTEGEMAVLIPLLQQPDHVHTCRQLANAAWDYAVDELAAQSLIRPHISRLRQKLELDPNHPQYLRTVRGKGYLLALA